MPTVEVVLAWPHRCDRVTLTVADGATVADALILSGLPVDPEIGVGVFGARVSLNTQLVDGDRVEIYRPLQFDPMEARRRRARR